MLSSLVRINVLLVVAVHPVDVRTEAIVECQLLVGLNVALGHEDGPVRATGEADLRRAVRILLVRVVGEAHQVAHIDCVDRDLCIDVKSVGATNFVVDFDQECFELAVVFLVENLARVLHDELVLLQSIQGEKANELVA